jgi:hypothetical protein
MSQYCEPINFCSLENILHEIKTLLHNKIFVSKLKRLPIEWEKIFVNYTSDKGLITRISRELKKLNSPKK